MSKTVEVTAEGLKDQAARSKHVASVALAEGKVATAKLAVLRTEAQVLRAEKSLAKVQESIVKHQDALRDLTSQESQLTGELAKHDEALDAAKKKVEEAETALHVLKG